MNRRIANCGKAILGVLGGMGVQTTARFYSMLTDMQDVRCEQDYVDVLIYSKPSVPDRTDFITGLSDTSPYESLLDAAKTLESAGVGCIAMPCVTAHFFYEQLTSAVGVPFINMIDSTVHFVKKSGYSKVGLLATDGALHSGVFQRTLLEHEINTVLPSEREQKFLMEAIYQIKHGKLQKNALFNLSAELYDKGAQAIVLGCTELGLLAKRKGYVYIEAMEVLAKAALRAVL